MQRKLRNLIATIDLNRRHRPINQALSSYFVSLYTSFFDEGYLSQIFADSSVTVFPRIIAHAQCTNAWWCGCGCHHMFIDTMMALEAIKYNEGRLEILNQLLLPAQSVYEHITSVQEAWEAIRSMKVRLSF